MTSGLDIQHAEDPLGAGHGALHVGPEGGDLLDGLVEALHVGQEGDDQAKRDGRAQEGVAAQQNHPADDGDDGHGHVAQRLQGRGQGGGDRTPP